MLSRSENDAWCSSSPRPSTRALADRRRAVMSSYTGSTDASGAATAAIGAAEADISLKQEKNEKTKKVPVHSDLSCSSDSYVSTVLFSTCVH